LIVRTRSFLVAGALACASVVPSPAEADERKKDVPLYTDDDLRRVSPRRGETGGGMTPAAPPARAEAERADRPAARGEAYWRREVERLQDRMQPLRDRIEDLRQQIEERRRRPGVRPYSDPKVEAMQRRLAALEQRVREAEDRLHERARRDGALPSWLR
jgi:hypothetical protein